MKNFGKSSRGRSLRVQKIFREPLYGIHCAAIFAIAQLSCRYTFPKFMYGTKIITSEYVDPNDFHRQRNR